MNDLEVSETIPPQETTPSQADLDALELDLDAIDATLEAEQD